MRRFVADCPNLLEQIHDRFSLDGYERYVRYWNDLVRDQSEAQSRLTRWAHFIYPKLPDVQKHTPDVFGTDHLWFLDWLYHSARRE